MSGQTCTKTSRDEILSLLNTTRTIGNCLCVFDLDKTLYKYNSGHQLLHNIISKSRKPIIAKLAFYIERILYKLKLPLNIEGLLTRLFVPKIDITSNNYRENMKIILDLLEDKSNYIPETYRLFTTVLEKKYCKTILILSNTPIDLSKLSICNNADVICISRYSVATKQGVTHIHDLYKFYINKRNIIKNMIKKQYIPCLVISDDPQELFEEFRIRILIKNNELYIC